MLAPTQTAHLPSAETSIDGKAPVARSIADTYGQVHLDGGLLTTAPESALFGFYLKRSSTFVPAIRIGRTGYLDRLRRHGFQVTYERSALPDGVVDVTPGDVKTALETPLESSCSTMALTMLAWVVNSLLLWSSCISLLAIAHARAALPENLEATAVEEGRWYEDLRTGFTLSLVYSLLIVDGIKVVCLTFTSPPALVRFGLVSPEALAAHDGRWVDAELPRRPRHQRILNIGRVGEWVRKILRRLHKVMDMIM